MLRVRLSDTAGRLLETRLDFLQPSVTHWAREECSEEAQGESHKISSLALCRAAIDSTHGVSSCQGPRWVDLPR